MNNINLLSDIIYFDSQEDLCGKRGLLPDTDQQTFMMALPRKLRVKYETVMLPVALEVSIRGYIKNEKLNIYL